MPPEPLPPLPEPRHDPARSDSTRRAANVGGIASTASTDRDDAAGPAAASVPATPATPASLTDPALATDARPRVLARVPDRPYGLATLSRLALGDRSALGETGVVAPEAYDTQVHEWALGWHRIERAYYLVSGGPTKVDWAGPALDGLQAVAHTHALREADRASADGDRHGHGYLRGDGGASDRMSGISTMGAMGGIGGFGGLDGAGGLPGRGLTAADALARWQREFRLPIGAMPGDLWYLFPSNDDIVAAYHAAQRVSEFVYTPFRLGPDGWLSRHAGQTISVQYGPVTAALRPDAAERVRALNVDPLTADGLRAAEMAAVEFLWSPLKFRNGGIIFGSGWMQVDPVRGLDGRAPELAWFREAGPSAATSRTDVQAFVRRAAGA